MPYSYVPAFLLMLETGNPNVLPNGSIFVPSVAPSVTRIKPIVGSDPHSAGIVCGECDRMDYLHPFTEYPFCNRTAQQVASGIGTIFHDNQTTRRVLVSNVCDNADCDCHADPFFSHPESTYTTVVDDTLELEGDTFKYEDYRLDGTIHEFFDGPGTREDEDYEDQYEPDIWPSDETLDAYQDKYPDEMTSLLGEPTPTHDYEPETRTAYIENEAGTSEKLIDFQVTKNFHKKLLNIFIDKNQQIAVGSMRFRRNTDQTVTATCVQGYCNASVTTNSDYTREDMEKFIYACIGHGNNHSAKWMRERTVTTEVTRIFGDYYGPTVVTEPTETFYKVHARDCDLNCDPLAATCNHNATPYLTASEELEFLQEHVTICSDRKCQCREWITLDPSQYHNLFKLERFISNSWIEVPLSVTNVSADVTKEQQPV